jgi:hypothetical protein
MSWNYTGRSIRVIPRRRWKIFRPIQTIRYLIFKKKSLRSDQITHGAEPFLRSRQLCSYSRTSQHFMDPEGSLPLPWYLSWARSIQSIPFHPVSLRSLLILSARLRHGLSSGLFPSDFLTSILDAFLFSPFVLHALTSSSSLTWSF